MDKESAKELIRNTFEAPFEKDKFVRFIKELLNKIEESTFIYKGNYIRYSFKQYISTFERIGKYTNKEKKIDLLIVNLKKETSLERARTMQRNFISRYLEGSRGGKLKDAALVAFVSPDNEDWRFSLVKMEYKLTQTKTGRLKGEEEFTPARRWSFLVGKNERSHTAQKQLVDILADDKHNPTLEQLEHAFSVERVTEEFFEKYRDLFIKTVDELEKVIKKDENVRNEFHEKNINSVDFAKKFLGQIVFLYFLQKKGWLGVPKDKNWGEGDRNFLRSLFKKCLDEKKSFFNDYLEKLFYDSLNNPRSDQTDPAYSRYFNCKIPFLNGGLFEPIGYYNWKDVDINLPNELFSNKNKTKEGDTGDGILDVFDRFNFTVREDEPLEKEVAIDPELLGKLYEKFNAIRPDNFNEYKEALLSKKKNLEKSFNKQYGVYYTPREIVHYMCQESLINYIYTTVNEEIMKNPARRPKQTKFIGPDEPEQLAMPTEREILRKEDIETFIKYGENLIEREQSAIQKEKMIEDGKQKTTTIKPILPESIRIYADIIDNALRDVKVCDPAVGSGAFPVEMMREIVNARFLLSIFTGHKVNLYDLKSQCIENSLYGVDIDPGACEIAKLRLWLSLVVDEEDITQIRPLPNLDYKIVCGNSLIGVEKNLLNFNLFDELEKIKQEYFNEVNQTEKQKYKKKIKELIYEITNGHKEFDFEVYFSEVFH